MSLSHGIHYTSVSVMFGAGLLMLWLLLTGYSIRDLSARAIFSLTGHLRTRPDPWLESALRNALTDFDRELAAILHDRAHPKGPAWPARSGGTEHPSGSADKPKTGKNREEPLPPVTLS